MKIKEVFTVNEHFIPSFYTYFWSENNDIKRISKEVSKYKNSLYVENVGYENCFFQENLYELKVTDEDSKIVNDGYVYRNYIEDNYSKIETKYSILFKKLLKRFDNANFYDKEVLSEKEKNEIVFFVAALYLRNPNSKELSELYKDIETDMTEQEKKDALFWANNLITSNTKQEEWEKIGKKASEGTYTFIIKATGGYSFVIGDNPVLIHGWKGFFLPISKDYAILTLSKKFSCKEMLVKKNKFKLIPANKKDILLANQKMLECASNFICMCPNVKKEQLESLENNFKDIKKNLN